MPKKIISIKIKKMVDESADTSYLGEYSARRAKFSFDREFLRDMNRNELRYFNPYTNPLEGKTQKERKELYDQAKQQYERMESLNRGNWQYIGIQAEAQIEINGTLEYITSGGLWGIESDSGRDYIDEVGKEQMAELKGLLRELGFSKRQIEKVEIKESD